MWNLLSGYCSNLHSARPVAYPVVMMSQENTAGGKMTRNVSKFWFCFLSAITLLFIIMLVAFSNQPTGDVQPDPTVNAYHQQQHKWAQEHPFK